MNATTDEKTFDAGDAIVMFIQCAKQTIAPINMFAYEAIVNIVNWLIADIARANNIDLEQLNTQMQQEYNQNIQDVDDIIKSVNERTE